MGKMIQRNKRISKLKQDLAQKGIEDKGKINRIHQLENAANIALIEYVPEVKPGQLGGETKGNAPSGIQTRLH